MDHKHDQGLGYNSQCRSENDFTTIVEIIARSLLGHSLEGFRMPHPLPPPPSPLLIRQFVIVSQRHTQILYFILVKTRESEDSPLIIPSHAPALVQSLVGLYFVLSVVVDLIILMMNAYRQKVLILIVLVVIVLHSINKLVFELKITSRKN